jgi:hypothetical protein
MDQDRGLWPENKCLMHANNTPSRVHRMAVLGVWVLLFILLFGSFQPVLADTSWYSVRPQATAGAVTPEEPTVGNETPTPMLDGRASWWVVLVGGLAVVGAITLAAVAAVAVVLIARRGGKKAVSEQASPPKFFLQLSAGSLEVQVGQNAVLGIQAWKSTPQGGTLPVPEATIQVSLPPSPTGLVVTPAIGLGKLECIFASVNPTQCAKVTATITASVNELVASVQVVVSLVPNYKLQLDTQDPQDRLQSGGAHLWACARVIATPPDPQSPPEKLTERITFKVQGPNSDRVRCQSPTFKDGMQWAQLIAEPLAPGTALPPGNPTLVAACMIGGQCLEASLVLLMNENLVLNAWAQGKKFAEVIYQDEPTSPGWFFGSLSVYFHPPEDENKPIIPTFPCDLSHPLIQTDPPDLLELRNEGEVRPGYYSADVSLRAGADLERYFGSELTERNAQIRLTVTVPGEAGKTYQSSVIYQICPTAELVARSCDAEGNPVQERAYKGLNLRKMEFLADGDDRLNFMVCYRRTDWPAESERCVPFGQITKMELRGPFSNEYQASARGEPFRQVEGNLGLWYTSVSSVKPLLATTERQRTALTLHIEGQITGKPSHYRTKSAAAGMSRQTDSLEQALQPKFLYLNLWVIPGWRAGTSLAGAVAMALQPDGKPLQLTQEYKLELCTRSFGLGGIAIEEVQSLTGMDEHGNTGEISLPDWLKAWRLTYNGLTWEGIKLARFDVLCRFSQADEAVEYKINIEENGAAMFAALISDADKLDLNNPEWDQRQNFWSLALLNKIILPDFRGPIYNMRRAVYLLLLGEANTPFQYRHYSCGDYSLRIRSYLQQRRHVEARTALRMNGLEVCSFKIPKAHDWAGIYLSGMDPAKDPIFIDPWYEQRWSDKATRANYGYKYQAVRFMVACSGAIAELYLVGRFIWQCMHVWRGQAIVPSLAEVTTALKKVAAELKLKVTALRLEISGGGQSWKVMKPNRSVPEQDAHLDYIFERELDLFDQYCAELKETDSLPPVKAVKWLKAG